LNETSGDVISDTDLNNEEYEPSQN